MPTVPSGALEDADDYKAFEADAQSAVERELVLRLASLLWRLRRATTMETGLFEIQTNHLKKFRQARQPLLALDALDRRKPQERTRRFRVDDRAALPIYQRDDC